jgi:hypothetical protein
MKWLWMGLVAVVMLTGCDTKKAERPGKPDRTHPKDTVPDDEHWRQEGEYDPESDHAARPQALMSAESQALGMSGLPVGAYNWPETNWCSGFITATAEILNYQSWLPGIKDADECNIRIVSPIPRKYFTANGNSVGTFSMTKAKAAIDKIVPILNNVPPSARDNLSFVSILDDMCCKTCWPPEGISPAQTAELTRYARQKFPSWVAVGLRVDPMWMARAGSGVNWGVDVSVMQWHKKKGPRNLSGLAKQRAWYEEGRQTATKVGVPRVIYSVNVLKCDGGGNDAPPSPCSPTELEAYLTQAINFDPATNCGSVSWKWAPEVWTKAYQDVWRRLVALGISKTKKLCKA